MEPTLELPRGFRVGHWTHDEARTGCTVILCPDGTVGGGEIRGSSPGSRETPLLESEKSAQHIHALLLTGGSAFGLAAADGVMRWLEEQGIGYETPWARVPLVPAAVVYDLNEGSATVRPTADSGYRACASAVPRVDSTGRHGAGTGVSVGKWAGIEHRSPGGIGAAELHLDDLHLTALAVVNAVGDVLGEDGGIIAGARGEGGRWLGADDRLRRFRLERGAPVPGTNTTLVAVMTNARLSKVDANRVARRMHNGFARALRPVHTSFDGDAAFTLASGLVDATLDLVAEAAADTAAAAIRNAVRSPLG